MWLHSCLYYFDGLFPKGCIRARKTHPRYRVARGDQPYIPAATKVLQAKKPLGAEPQYSRNRLNAWDLIA